MSIARGEAKERNSATRVDFGGLNTNPTKEWQLNFDIAKERVIERSSYHVFIVLISRPITFPAHPICLHGPDRSSQNIEGATTIGALHLLRDPNREVIVDFSTESHFSCKIGPNATWWSKTCQYKK